MNSHTFASTGNDVLMVSALSSEVNDMTKTKEYKE